MRPPSAAPRNRPKVAELNTTPAQPGDRPNSATTRGATTPMDWLSKPSTTAAAAHSSSVMRAFGLDACSAAAIIKSLRLRRVRAEFWDSQEFQNRRAEGFIPGVNGIDLRQMIV